MLQLSQAGGPQSLVKLRPDAAGDEARGGWTFIIITPAGLAAIQPHSLHFVT